MTTVSLGAERTDTHLPRATGVARRKRAVAVDVPVQLQCCCELVREPFAIRIKAQHQNVQGGQLQVHQDGAEQQGQLVQRGGG